MLQDEIKIKDKKTKINLLLVLFNFYEEGMASGPEVMGIYGYSLPKKGHKIDWIMPFKNNKLSIICTKKFLNTNIYLISFTKSKNMVLMGASYLIYYIRLFIFLLLFSKKYDVIQVRDDVFSSIFVLITCYFYKKKFIFNYSFPFYEAALEASRLGRPKLSFRLPYWKLYDIILKKIVLKKANYIFPISNEMLYQLSCNGLNINKMHPMPLGVEPNNFKISKYKIKSKGSLGFCKEDFILLYIGSLNKIRGLDIIINAFSKAIINNPNIKLIFVGDGDGIELLKEKTKLYGLENCILFTGKVSYSLVPGYIYHSDACLSIIEPLKCYYVCSPCKLFEYLYMGKPVIANEEIPEHKRIIQSSNGGILVKYNEESITNAILEMASIYNDPYKYTQLGERGRKWIIENRTFDIISKDIEQIYLNLINFD
jgi:glycosyltransferase involved in cell wall biosynthesis